MLWLSSVNIHQGYGYAPGGAMAMSKSVSADSLLSHFSGIQIQQGRPKYHLGNDTSASMQ